MKKLILIDDHAMLRSGIAYWITQNSDWQIALQCGNFSELQKSFSSMQIAEDDFVIAVVDLSYKQDSSKIESETGWEIIKWLNSRNVPSLVFSSHDTGTFIEKAMSREIQAKGFVSKNSNEKILMDALEMISQGKTYIQPDLFSSFIETKTILEGLIPKEREVADLMLHNVENEEIARKLNIQLHTVENYVSKIYDKTGTHSRKEFIEKLL